MTVKGNDHHKRIGFFGRYRICKPGCLVKEWVSSNPSRCFYMYYRPGSPGDRLRRSLAGKSTPNLGAMKTQVSHHDTPTYYLASRLREAPFLVDRSKCLPGMSKEQKLSQSADEEAEPIEWESVPPPIRVMKQPLPVPVGNPVPFAPTPPVGSYWPGRTRHKYGRWVSFQAADNSIRDEGRMFLANRKVKKNNQTIAHWHVGVDLFANAGDEVVACENDMIIDSSFF